MNPDAAAKRLGKSPLWTPRHTCSRGLDVRMSITVAAHPMPGTHTCVFLLPFQRRMNSCTSEPAMRLVHLLPLMFVFAVVSPPGAHAVEHPVYGPLLQGFDYPHEVEHFKFESQRQTLTMAYMDVAPTGEANGRTVVLLHGKNFCAATWEVQIKALTAAGYRVIAPDQIGFCKSSKPERYQFSLAQLAGNTHALLESLGIKRAAIVGHSMGGMLAARYALQYPQATTQLVMVDPLGLEDWRAKGVPWVGIDKLYAKELRTDYASI